MPAPPAAHRPYETGPFRMAMGLQAIAEPDWLEFADDAPAQMAERRRLLHAAPESVIACLPEAQDAAAELLEVLAAHLCTHHAAAFRRDGNSLQSTLQPDPINLAGDPLRAAGLLAQEDFCLMQPHPDGHRLTAAVLCFPSRWSLAEKLGKPLPSVHAEVPFYGDRLANPVERFFTSLRHGRLAQRLNWSVVDDPRLFQVGGKHRTAFEHDIDVENALDRLWLRVERQTFRRLPRTGCIVFGIRIHVTPLDRVAREPGEAARLSEAIQALPMEMRTYKSIGPFIAVLTEVLGRAAA